MFLTVLIYLLHLTTATKAEEDGVFFKVEEDHFLFNENTVWNEKVNSLWHCSQMCARRDDCKAANFMTEQNACSLFSEGQTRNPKGLLKRDGCFYLEKVDSPEKQDSLGTTQQSAVRSCQTLRSQSPPPSSGVYWINPEGGSQDNAFKAYCEMDTDGGGWNLVWSYTFTNYHTFKAHSNAITPRPNWPIKSHVDVAISTTPPLKETDYNAMNFSQWKQLGRQILIKSNINNWLICDPGTGSLVDWQEGSVNCSIVKRVTRTCSTTPAPSMFATTRVHGPIFYSTGLWRSTYYYFDGYTGDNWPTHDPCGSGRANHLQGVADAHGNIFIR